MTRHKYDNQVSPENAYGHALELLARHARREAGQVHLDLACGLAPIASHVAEVQGSIYIGLDADLDALEVLRARGFETHEINLNDLDIHQTLVSVLDGRPLASVTMLDGLEHLLAGDRVLAAISRLLRDHDAVGVFSVPNVTHFDVAAKALLGRWDYTETGLLDHTHIRFYTGASLEAALKDQGMGVLDTYDVVLEASDQHVPLDHPALSRDTPVGQFLRTLREGADDHAITNQFIWAVGPARAGDVAVEEPVPSADPHPFLSVIVPTSGTRPQALRESLLCLTGQSDPDFEVLLVGAPTLEGWSVLEQVVGDLPAGMSRRVRVLRTEAAAPGAVRNAGLDASRGRYISVLDEGDLVLGAWVRSFHDAQPRAGSRVIRALSAVQEHVQAEVRGRDVVRAEGSPHTEGPSSFSPWRHALDPVCPGCSWAWPRSMTQDLGLRYDPSVPDDPDWEFLNRAGQLVGVVDVLRVTAVHRKGLRPGGHDTAGSAAAREVIERRPVLLPPGGARRIETDLTHAAMGHREESARTQAALASTAEELRLTSDHAGNLERMLAQRDATITELRKKLSKRSRRVEKLRFAATSAAERGQDNEEPRRWRRRK